MKDILFYKKLSYKILFIFSIAFIFYILFAPVKTYANIEYCGTDCGWGECAKKGSEVSNNFNEFYYGGVDGGGEYWWWKVGYESWFVGWRDSKICRFIPAEFNRAVIVSSYFDDWGWTSFNDQANVGLPVGGITGGSLSWYWTEDMLNYGNYGTALYCPKKDCISLLNGICSCFRGWTCNIHASPDCGRVINQDVSWALKPGQINYWYNFSNSPGGNNMNISYIKLYRNPIKITSSRPFCERNASQNNAQPRVELKWTAGNADWFRIIKRDNYNGNESSVGIEGGRIDYDYIDPMVAEDRSYTYFIRAYKGGNYTQASIGVITCFCNNSIQGLSKKDDNENGPEGNEANINVSVTVGANWVGDGTCGTNGSIQNRADGVHVLGGLGTGTYNITAALGNPNYLFTGYSICPNCITHDVNNAVKINPFSSSMNINNIVIPMRTYTDLWFGVKEKSTPAEFKVLMVGNSININRDNIKINYDSNAVNNPPPGFKELLTPIWEETNP